MTTRAEVFAVCDSIDPDEKGCKKWPGLSGKTLSDYYGKVKIGRIVYRVPKIILERKLGRPIELGKQALHTCDHKWCVADAHLYEGTPKNNTADQIERNPKAFSHLKTPEHRERARKMGQRKR